MKTYGGDSVSSGNVGIRDPVKRPDRNTKYYNTPNSGGVSGGNKVTYTGKDGQKKQGVVLDDNGQIDIGTKIKEAINKGQGYGEIQNLLNQRNDKIASNPNQLGRYQYDAVANLAKDYINQKKLDEYDARWNGIQAQAEAAEKARVSSAINALEGQKEELGQSYEDLYRQLYYDKRAAEKNLPQQMAFMGYTGGLSESAQLALQTGYQDALRQGEQQRIGALSDIDRAMTDARLKGETSIAEQAAQLARQGLLSYSDLVQAQQDQRNWERQFGFGQEQFRYGKDQAAQENARNEYWRNKQWNYGAQQDAYSREKEYALALAAVGDYSAVGRLWGLTEEQVKSLTAEYARQRGLSDEQARRELAEFYGRWGDFSQLRQMGVNVAVDPTQI